MPFKMCFILIAHSWLNEFGHECKVAYGPYIVENHGIKIVFFNNGTKMAHFKSPGKIPDMREEFIILVIRESSSLLLSLSNQVKIGSNWPCLVGLETISFSTAASESTQKEDNWSDCGQASKNDWNFTLLSPDVSTEYESSFCLMCFVCFKISNAVT